MKRDARQVLTEWLVLSAQGADEGAFHQLHELWQADLWRWARVRVDDEGGAEEVTQDAWVTIARTLRRLDDPACFPRWAYRIVERRAVDWIRGRQRDRRRADRFAEQVQSPDNRGVSDEEIRLREAIAGLDAAARELLHLYYEAGLSVIEISEVLAVPAGTVKSRLHATRENLKQILEKTSQ